MEPEAPIRHAINNALYSTLGDRWYDADDDPVALLRAESRLRNPWIAARVPEQSRVLDVGCGAGFLANFLARRGHRVVGVDLSLASLAVARAHDLTRAVVYREADAYHLPFAEASFDVVCAMDFLEHVDEPARVVAEAARVLVPGGRFFFHTFNRSWLAWLVVIKGVEWFVRNTPRDMHVLPLFIKPRELALTCVRHGLRLRELRGSRPRLDRAFLAMLATGRVGSDFAFKFTRSTILGYSGWAQKS